MNSARYEAVWINGVWVVRDRWVWDHRPVAPQTKVRAVEAAKARTK